MTTNNKRGRCRLTYGVLLCGLLLLTGLFAGCNFGGGPVDGTPSESQTPPPSDELPNSSDPPPTSVESRQLVLWLPEFFNPLEDSSAGSVIEGAFFQFEQNHPGLSLDVQIKTEFGQTGFLSYLRAAQRVAPSIMPDLILVHSSQLWQIADLGIVPALEPHEGLDHDAYFPFAVEAITYRDQVYGVPYAANVLHSVVNAETFDAPPANWDEILAQDTRYLFPAGGVEGIRLGSAIMHYLAAGGELEEEGGSAVDLNALETLFEFLILGRERGIIPDTVLEHVSYDSLWSAFRANPGDMAIITSQDYLLEAGNSRFLYSTPPTADAETITTIGNVWAFAVLTRDEERRELALELVEYLQTPDIHAAWSQAAQRLPTQPEAFARWVGQSEYFVFLESLMPAAQAIPSGRPFADFARRLHNAQAGLLRGELTLDEAINEARTLE